MLLLLHQVHSKLKTVAALDVGGMASSALALLLLLAVLAGWLFVVLWFSLVCRILPYCN